jgi:hypothetical protein
VTTLLLNTSRTEGAVVEPAGTGAGAEIRLVDASPEESRVRLNGSVLEPDGQGNPPATPGVPIDGTVELPPSSYAFLTEPGARAQDCGGPVRRLTARLEAPSQTLAAVRRSGYLRVRCEVDEAATCTARATIAPRLARRLGLGRERTVVADGDARLAGPGSARTRLRLTRRARRALSGRSNPVRLHLAAIATAESRRDGTAHAKLVLKRRRP